jgi:hypothetical protein
MVLRGELAGKLLPKFSRRHVRSVSAACSARQSLDRRVLDHSPYMPFQATQQGQPYFAYKRDIFLESKDYTLSLVRPKHKVVVLSIRDEKKLEL